MSWTELEFWRRVFQWDSSYRTHLTDLINSTQLHRQALIGRAHSPARPLRTDFCRHGELGRIVHELQFSKFGLCDVNEA